MALRVRTSVPMAFPDSRHMTWDSLIDSFFNIPVEDREQRVYKPTIAGPTSFFHEVDNKFVLTIEAPGIPKENIKLEVKDNVLKISGEAEQAKENQDSENGKATPHFYRARSFQRSISLGNDIAQDQITATAKDGVITIELPKRVREDPPVRTISVL
ncbi:Small heat shock protein C4 [Porphyridium purpureum]|uniref:Small heat shock protein C4 n=1 Tax=Porphyridium purpureum TaxID=35688 RepID=A0A5J4YP18_PORPP|nr:Small heat shock protein C4 [Porphyridium purpureum]|eukprot:POR8116..scf295_9